MKRERGGEEGMERKEKVKQRVDKRFEKSKEIYFPFHVQVDVEEVTQTNIDMWKCRQQKPC